MKVIYNKNQPISVSNENDLSELIRNSSFVFYINHHTGSQPTCWLLSYSTCADDLFVKSATKDAEGCLTQIPITWNEIRYSLANNNSELHVIQTDVEFVQRLKH